jgi:PKD domain-containing protein
MFTASMVSRSARIAVLGVFTVLAALSIACQKVPLLAPSGSSITITATASALPINGTTDVIAQVIEAAGTPPHEGTRVVFTTTLGHMEPSEADTDVGGRAVVKFVAGNVSGVAAITALSGGTAVKAADAVKIQVGAAAVGGVSITASPGTLTSAGGTSTISATVFDASGNTLPGVPVTFAIDTTTTGASGAGSLSANIVNSDANGRASTLLTTSRTTIVVATAGVATTSGTGGTATATSAQTARVTVNVNSTASITIGTPSPASPAAGQAVTIPLTFGTAAAASASPIVRGTVDWGDGSVQTFTGQPASVSHVYRSAGSFLIVVTGIDAIGDVSTATASLIVAQQPKPVVTIAAAASPKAGTATAFTVTVTEPTGSTATITSVTIDYGDGKSDTLQGNVSSVQHVYAASGTYRVTAIANDSNGQSGSGSTVIFVTP